MVITAGRPEAERGIPPIRSWNDLMQNPARAALEAALPAWLRERRWFGGKARKIASVSIEDIVPIPIEASPPGACVALARADFTEGEPQTYILPLARAGGAVPGQPPAIARAEIAGRMGLLGDASADPAFCRALLDAIGSGRSFPGVHGALEGRPTTAFAELRGPAETPLDPVPLKGEQSNTSIRFGRRLILKIFRRHEGGESPDLEIGRYLTETSPTSAIPRLAGAIEYRAPGGRPSTLAILQAFAENQGDAWTFTLRSLADFYRRVLAAGAPPPPPAPGRPFLAAAREGARPEDAQWIGAYIESARLLARRTAELHIALAKPAEDPNFAPEPFSPAETEASAGSMLAHAARALGRLAEKREGLAGKAREEAGAALAARGAIDARLRSLAGAHLGGRRTRIHGDYHLGQILVAGSDFLIIDFEGEPARPLEERRRKRSPLADVAGMLRSFQYAASAAMVGQGPAPPIPVEDRPRLEPWTRLWQLGVSAAFLSEYLRVASGGDFLSENKADVDLLLECHLLEKAVYEVEYELNNRPDWVRIPLQGILDLVSTSH